MCFTTNVICTIGSLYILNYQPHTHTYHSTGLAHDSLQIWLLVLWGLDFYFFYFSRVNFCCCLRLRIRECRWVYRVIWFSNNLHVFRVYSFWHVVLSVYVWIKGNCAFGEDFDVCDYTCRAVLLVLYLVCFCLALIRENKIQSSLQ